MDVDYSPYFEAVLQKIDNISSMLEYLNSCMYIIIFGIAGIGLIYMLYKFLKNFI